MIDYFISNPTKKISLFWSWIFKVMNFLIFRDFSNFILFFNLFRISLDLKNKKNQVYITR